MWKKIIIDNQETNYSVSSLGEVRNDQREKILKQATQGGYKFVTLSINNRAKRLRVHRLVAEAFISNIEKKPYVNHKDGNRSNNKVENLEWVTPAENTQHAVQTGLLKPSRSVKVVQYSLNGERIKEFESQTEAANALGIQQAKISDVCNGKRQTTGGFQWRYASDNIKKLPSVEVTNTKKKVLQIDKFSNQVLNIYNSIAEAARAVNGTASAISRVCSGTAGTHTHKGFKWKIVDDMIQ